MSRRMSFKDAVDFVPDDLPDGAFWAMAHDIAGLDYGDGFAELAPTKRRRPKAKAMVPAEELTAPCRFCGKLFRTGAGRDHHQRDKHGKRLAKEAKAAETVINDATDRQIAEWAMTPANQEGATR